MPKFLSITEQQDAVQSKKSLDLRIVDYLAGDKPRKKSEWNFSALAVTIPVVVIGFFTFIFFIYTLLSSK